MRAQRKDIEVRIGRRTLWVGARAYPLQLVTGVEAVEILLDGALHVLSIAMEGESHAALVSEDRQVIHNLTARLVDAIDNPAVEYVIHVNHIDLGGDASILSEMTGMTATPTRTRPAARSAARVNLRAHDRAADQMPTVAERSHDAVGRQQLAQLGQLRALVEREGGPAVHQAVTNVLLTLHDVAAATATVARERP